MLLSLCNGNVYMTCNLHCLQIVTFFENKIMGIFFSLNFTMFPAVNTTVLSLNGMAPQEVQEKNIYISNNAALELRFLWLQISPRKCTCLTYFATI